MRGERMLRRGRDMAESRMSERVDFFTESDEIDEVTLQPVRVETVIASGVPARVRSANRDSRDVDTAGQSPAVSQLTLSVPIGSVKVGPSVFIRVVSSSADAGLVGSRYRTKDYPALGQVSAWRYPVEQVS